MRLGRKRPDFDSTEGQRRSSIQRLRIINCPLLSVVLLLSLSTGCGPFNEGDDDDESPTGTPAAEDADHDGYSSATDCDVLLEEVRSGLPHSSKAHPVDPSVSLLSL